MKLRSKSIRSRFFSSLCALSVFLMSSPVLLAAAEEEETSSDPVWVLSYAAFLVFSGGVIMIALFFSKRRDTQLDMEEQKKVSQLRADRVTKRRKEEKQARMQQAREKKRQHR